MGNLFPLKEVNKLTTEWHQRRRRLETQLLEKRLSRTCALFATTSRVTTPDQCSRVLTVLSQLPRRDSLTQDLCKDSRVRSGQTVTSTNTSSPQLITHQETQWLSPVSLTPRTEPMSLLISSKMHEQPH